MKSIIRSKDIEVTKSIKEYIEEKLSKVDKYFKNPDEITANILLKVKGHDQTIEVTIPTKNILIRNEVEDVDLYAAIDLVMDKIERQIRKNKEKITKIDRETILDLNHIEENIEDKSKITKERK